MRWTSNDRFEWERLSCAAVYNVYRHTGQLEDADGDGLADEYGTCFRPDVLVTEAFNPSDPPIGTVNTFWVTGEDPSGAEGPLGNTSSGLMRPNRTPCP